MRGGKNNKIKLAIFMGIILIAITFAALILKNIKNIDVNYIVDFLRQRKDYAVLIYLLMFALKPILVFIPSNIIVISGGIIFGPFKGLLLAMAGFFISATISFYGARFLGKDFVQGLMGKKFIDLDKKLENSGFKLLLLIRLIPVVPYDPVCYACGFTNMSYFTYIVPSILGVLPESFCYNLMGKNVDNPLSIKFLLPLVLIAVLALVSKKFLNLKKIK